MKNGWSRLSRTGFLQCISIVFAMAMCCAMLLLSLLRPPLQTQANEPHLAPGSAQSSPSSGPAGAIIQVSGSGWQSIPDGTLVSFGYSTNSNCSSSTGAGKEQPGNMTGGSFSGWFQWPSGTELNTYTVCAFMSNIVTPASTYTVQSTSPPQLSVSPSPLIAGRQATATGQNYFPAGTFVPIVLQSGSNGNSDVLGSALSNASGSFSLTFTVPGNILGSATITANAGRGQPPTLSSSAPVMIQVQSVPPTPTPKPSPTPTSTPAASATATPAPMVTPTHTVSTPTAIATSAPTSTPIPVATVDPGSNTTPTLGSTTIANQTNPTPNTTSSNSQSALPSPLTIGAGVLVLLLAFLGTLLLLRSRVNRARTARAVIPPSGIQPWKTLPILDTNIPVPTQGQFQPNNGEQRLPMNGGQVGTFGAGNDAQTLADNGSKFPPAMPPQFSPPPDISPMNGAVPFDPALEAAMRQAQMGLFATPRQSREV